MLKYEVQGFNTILERANTETETTSIFNWYSKLILQKLISGFPAFFFSDIHVGTGISSYE
jgi:hypothetical protein